jgi:cell wall-associated NlpC family hydrolase
MSHSTTHRSALRASAQTTVRLLVVAGLAAGVLLAALAPSQAANRRGGHPPRPHHGHHGRHHHPVRHHHAPHHPAHHPALGPAAGRVAHAMSVAVAQRGKPYRYGASGPAAFDCSGLTSYAFHHAGFRAMPRTAAAQAGFVRHIARNRMHRGDLIFFNGGGRVYHVGLYAGMFHGRKMVLHAPYGGQRVHAEPLWTNAWFPGTLRFR